MTFDYDLVIIGGSLAGFYAAAAAASLKARVALVVPPVSSAASEATIPVSSHRQTLAYLSALAQQLTEAHQFGIYCTAEEEAGQSVSIRFAEAMQWAIDVNTNLEEQHSLAVLASMGVDALAGKGQFYPKPHLGFEVKERRLRSRAYLLATGSRPAMPEIEGLEATGFLTGDEIAQKSKLKQPPASLIVIGASPSGVELAQTFARLGSRVTLVTKSSHILPKEDPEAALLMQAYLEADGVRILTNKEVTQAKRIDEKKWVQAGNQALEADEILLAGRQVPNVESLNLESVGVKWYRKGISVNEKLQTTNPRIYACSDFVDGCQLPHLAIYEADIAVKNALFLPLLKVDYRGIPRAVFTEPQLARVGMTEPQALARYGRDNVVVLRQYFKALAKAQITGQTTGFCKIIARRNGEILGVSLVGAQAAELIHVFALAMREKIKVEALASLSYVWPTFSEIAKQTAVEWHRYQRSRYPRFLDFLEWFFNWRRR